MTHSFRDDDAPGMATEASYTYDRPLDQSLQHEIEQRYKRHWGYSQVSGCTWIVTLIRKLDAQEISRADVANEIEGIAWAQRAAVVDLADCGSAGLPVPCGALVRAVP